MSRVYTNSLLKILHSYSLRDGGFSSLGEYQPSKYKPLEEIADSPFNLSRLPLSHILAFLIALGFKHGQWIEI